ncbi:hypothetical protein ACFPVT_00940 [Corynebacterium choanae]|uniref:SWIM-type domain-containing protein n=1 Tax=Corynebacterium choanae TaxID=1862358 RepID=A0A3G6JA08_9CORY|nr:hypothetical protein [Corynebacterium choanae]AZA13290.1 hypothetical protein CCHOA_04405 [Corynebacterium choanae]
MTDNLENIINLDEYRRKRRRRNQPRRLADPPADTMVGWMKDWLAQHTDTGRINRGLQYLGDGRLISLQVAHDRIQAAIKGTALQPFVVDIVLPAISLTVQRRLHQQLHDTNRLRQPDIETISQLLLPGKQPEYSHCNCPDYDRGNLCKHLVCVWIQLAQQLDAQPDLIYQWRDLNWLAAGTPTTTAAETAAIVKTTQTRTRLPAVVDRIPVNPIKSAADNQPKHYNNLLSALTAITYVPTLIEETAQQLQHIWVTLHQFGLQHGLLLEQTQRDLARQLVEYTPQPAPPAHSTNPPKPPH